jgi:glucokinase
MRALALDMGGTHIACGVVEDTRLLEHTSIATEGASGLTTLLPMIADALHSLLRDTATAAAQCAGVAIGFPGIVDARNGTIYSTLKKYEDAPGINLAAWAHEAFGLDLRIENDARLALMGEQFAGAACGVEDVVMMTLGTGIGTAVFLHGHLLRGAHAHAGCLGGHLTTKFDGRTCHCGNIGCAEAEASGWSMPLVARAWPGFAHSSLASLETLGFQQLFMHAETGDTIAQQVRERCLHVWAANAVSLIHTYDPEILILGGGVTQSADMIIPFIQNYVNQHTWSSWGKAQIRATSLGTSAALLGAIPLLSEEMHGASI